MLKYYQMKTNIYYFTSTGNSLVIARDIASGLENAILIDIAKVMNKEIDLSADNIGIVFPVYVWGMPMIVVDFLKKFSNIKDKYIFAVATYGGFPAGTLVQVKKQLKSLNSDLSAGFGVFMPGNYTPMYGAYPEETQKKRFAEAKEKVKKITSIIKAKKEYGPEKNSFLVNWLFSKIIYKSGVSHFVEADKAYWAQDTCDGCRICEKVCPVQNIKMENNKPVWLHHCLHCLGCLQWCPKEAIQFKKSTIGRKRYHHPEVKLKDILQK